MNASRENMFACGFVETSGQMRKLGVRNFSAKMKNQM